MGFPPEAGTDASGWQPKTAANFLMTNPGWVEISEMLGFSLLLFVLWRFYVFKRKCHLPLKYLARGWKEWSELYLGGENKTHFSFHSVMVKMFSPFHVAAGLKLVVFFCVCTVLVLVCNNKRKTSDFKGHRVLVPPMPVMLWLCCITCDVFMW